MRFTKRNVNLLSFLITSFIIIIILFIFKGSSYLAIKNNEENMVQENKNQKVKIWEIKIPEIMLNQIVKEEKIETNNIAHYKKSFIENGTIILFCNRKLDRTNNNLKVFYRVDDKIFLYEAKEKGTIKKQDIDRLLGEENRIYLLNDNGESYYFIKCDFKGEIQTNIKFFSLTYF